MNSIKKTARAAGLLYLTIFIAVPVAGVLGSLGIQIAGEDTAPAGGLITSEALYRLGMVGESIVFLVEIALAAVLYVLLRPVSRPISLAAAFARLAEAIVQGVNLIMSILVLLLVSGAGYLAVFEPEQLEALGKLFLDAREFVILLWGLFFGFHLLLLGYLVYKSGFWPRIIGALLALASLGYLAQSYGHMVAPQYDSILAAVVLVLAIPGELAFTAWLLWKGVDVERWKERALESERGLPI
jgi:hypothetical protein